MSLILHVWTWLFVAQPIDPTPQLIQPLYGHGSCGAVMAACLMRYAVGPAVQVLG
jgi:hypothetical protein